MIENDYKITWYLDNLPSGHRIALLTTKTKYNLYQQGFPIGIKRDDKYYIYNHHHIIIKVYKNPSGTWNVINFVVEPLSLKSLAISVCNDYDFELGN